jgi:hypothetical protein
MLSCDPSAEKASFIKESRAGRKANLGGGARADPLIAFD